MEGGGGQGGLKTDVRYLSPVPRPRTRRSGCPGFTPAAAAPGTTLDAAAEARHARPVSDDADAAPALAVAGVADHSGWAHLVTVALRDDGLPTLVDRRRCALVDEDVPRQPYHAAVALPAEEAEALVATVTRAAEAGARAALAALAADLAPAHRLAAITVRTTVGRPTPDTVAEVLASHSAVHTAEGELYREAWAAAAEAAGVDVSHHRRPPKGAAARPVDRRGGGHAGPPSRPSMASRPPRSSRRRPAHAASPHGQRQREHLRGQAGRVATGACGIGRPWRGAAHRAERRGPSPAVAGGRGRPRGSTMRAWSHVRRDARDDPEATRPTPSAAAGDDPDPTQLAEPVAGGEPAAEAGDDPDATQASPAATPSGDPETTQVSTEAVTPGPGDEPTAMIGSATSVFDTPPSRPALAPSAAGEARRRAGPAPDRGRQALIAVLALLIVLLVGFGAWLDRR